MANVNKKTEKRASLYNNFHSLCNLNVVAVGKWRYTKGNKGIT